MADKDVISAVVAAACAAAGPVGGASPAWKMKVNELIPEVAAVLAEGSRQWRTAEAMLDADHISGTYIGAEMEPSSTRLIVSILANNSTEPETLRTPRTDTPEGKRMQNQLTHVAEGDRIHIWKIVEPMRNDPNKKVRYIGHFESYGPPKDSGPAAPAADRTAPPPSSAAGGGGDLVSQINALSTVQKLAVRNGAARLGISNFMAPGNDEERGTIERLIKEQRNATSTS